MLSVFGGTGFLGTELVKRLNACNTKFELVPRNSLVCAGHKVIYLISTTDNYNIFSNPYLDIDTNLTHLMRVLESNPQIKEFNFVSSWFVYGDQEKLPVKEDAICKPKGMYSITKRCAEELLESYCKTKGIAYRIFRMSNLYGVGDRGVSKKKNALQYLISKIKNNEPINLYFNGDFYRDYLRVDEAARAIVHCLDNSEINDILNIGRGIFQLFGDIIEKAIQLTDSISIVKSVDQPEFHKIVQTKNMCLDISKLKATGFKCQSNVIQDLPLLIN